jgi:hypothetical protein
MAVGNGPRPGGLNTTSSSITAWPSSVQGVGMRSTRRSCAKLSPAAMSGIQQKNLKKKVTKELLYIQLIAFI